MGAIFVLALLIQVTESPGTDELGKIRGLRAEDPANGRLAFAEGQLALNAGQLAEAMSAFNDAVELLEDPGDLARAHHAVAVAQHQAAMSQVTQNPTLAKEMIGSAMANYAQALEYDPKLEPARRNGERAAQFASSVPPPPPESSGGEGDDQNASPDESEPDEGDPADGPSSEEPTETSEGESGGQNQDGLPQDSSSPPSGSEPPNLSMRSLSEEEARRILQEIRDRSEERQDELSARESRRRMVERDW